MKVLRIGALAALLTGSPFAASAQVPEAYISAVGSLEMGERVRFVTTRGDFTVVLFPNQAPHWTRYFLISVDLDRFANEHFFKVSPSGVQLGGSHTDMDPGGFHNRAARAWRRFDSNRLPHMEGSLIMDQRFTWGSNDQFPERNQLQREYFIGLGDAPIRNGIVIGHVVQGMDVVRTLRPQDRILIAHRD